MIYDHRDRIHDNIQTVLMYACPNINATYVSDCISATRWTGDWPECAVCGKTGRHHAVHHEPARSRGSLLLKSEMGAFVVKPTLILLCDMCHRKRHDTHDLTFEWVFDNPDDELAFLKGEFFKSGYSEHDQRFWNHGRLLITRDGMEMEVRNAV